MNWHSPRVRDVLRDYRNQKISSSRAVELIKKITGSLVSNATVRVKCRILDDLVIEMFLFHVPSFFFLCVSIRIA